jgi:2-keto-4-pentenoate hydratase/2-oxohepta-3-ene-1,7-dioic acid hydratase in catechol pathway
MKICRFTLTRDAAAKPRVGVMVEGGIKDITSVTDALPPLSWPLPPGDQFIANLSALRTRIEALAAGAPLLPREDVKLLSPVANLGKFICGAGNWKHHKAPFGMLGFLFKASSALAGPDEGVQVRWPDRTTLHEPELAIIIGKACSNVSEAEALSYVAGYTCALDMTMKEEKEFFCFCKSFDTFGVLGPCLVTTDEIPDPSTLGYRFWVNDEIRGERSFGDLTGNPAQMVAFASSAMTLYPGDAILSGAADVAPVVPGDRMVLEIPRLGRMEVSVSVSPNARRV